MGHVNTLVCNHLLDGLDDLEICEVVYLGKARRPSIFSRPGLIKRVLRLISKLTSAVKRSARRFREAVDNILKTNWPTAGEGERERALEQLGRILSVLPEEFIPGLTVILDAEGRAVLQQAHGELARKITRVTINPSFLAQNELSIAALSNSTSIFFKSEYERQATRFRARAQKILANGLRDGLSRRDIARDLRQEFQDRIANQAYWETVAAVHVNRARSFGAIATFANAGIEKYRVVAVLDDRTTDICRSLHGTEFPVAHAIERFQAMGAATSIEEVRDEAMPFLRSSGGKLLLPSGRDVTDFGPRGLMTNGIGTPPYHYRCRTTIEPVL